MAKSKAKATSNAAAPSGAGGSNTAELMKELWQAAVNLRASGESYRW